MNLVMEHLLEKVFEPERVPYFTDGLVPIHIVRRLIEQAEQSTEQRIIKLLEEYLSAFGAPQEQLMQRRMTDFIALIKGEKQ